jgi:hypothetical protein
MRAPPFSSFLSFNFPTHNSLSPTSLSLLPCAYVLRWRLSPDLDPQGELPSPFLSLSPALPPLLSPRSLPSSPPRARAPGAPGVLPLGPSLARPLTPPGAAVPALGGVAPWPPRTRPPGPPAVRPLGPGGGAPWPRWRGPSASLARAPPPPPGGAAPPAPCARLSQPRCAWLPARGPCPR